MNIKKVLTNTSESAGRSPVADDTEETLAIGLVITKDEVGDVVYQNVEFVIKDGRVTKTNLLEKFYAVNDAINNATYWIDRVYWKKDQGL